MARSHVNPRWVVPAVAALTALALAAAFVRICDMELNVDETFHYPQILRFLHHDFRLSPSITMLPGYHAGVFLLAAPLGLESPNAIRFVSFCIALLSIAAFYIVARDLHGAGAAERTFQYIFFPLLFPFFFVIYTDAAGLLAVFLGIHLSLRRRHVAAGVAGLLACLVRQDNIVWVGLMFVLLAGNAIRGAGGLPRAFAAPDRRRLAKIAGAVVRRGWPQLATFAAFALFVVANRGVAIGDRLNHPPLALQLANVWCLPFVFFFAFLPMNVANAARIARLLRAHPASALWIAGAFALFLATFRIDHPYNTEPWAQWFLSNRILAYFTQSVLHEAAFFAAALYAVLSLSRVELEDRLHYAIYPLSVVFLLPHWHIDPRYHLVPLLLFLAFKRADRPLVSRATSAMYVLLSAYVFYGIVEYDFFL